MKDTTKVRKLCRDDLPMILKWRNHIDVRRFMYTQHVISFEEHQRWFNNVSKDQKQHLLIFENNEIACGFVQFKEIVPKAIAEWGFYLAPDAPKGTGRLLGGTALNFAFNKLRLHKICGQALGYNDRSIYFHEKLGFKLEGTLRDQHFDGISYHNVICYGLLKNEWIYDENHT